MPEPKKPAREGNPKKILLGYGLFYIDDAIVGLTRGGGQFTVEREYRKIAADGDRGGYKGRIVSDGSIPKLKMNILEIIGDNFKKAFPATKVESSTSGDDAQATTDSITGAWDISDDEYHTVKWVGKTKAGKEVVIEVYNAINLDNIDLTLAEKDEVVPALTYEGTYTDDCEENYEPWKVTWVE